MVRLVNCIALKKNSRIKVINLFPQWELFFQIGCSEEVQEDAQCLSVKMQAQEGFEHFIGEANFALQQSLKRSIERS